jgi:type I site-specific restriction endonuclease
MNKNKVKKPTDLSRAFIILLILTAVLVSLVYSFFIFKQMVGAKSAPINDVKQSDSAKIQLVVIDPGKAQQQTEQATEKTDIV